MSGELIKALVKTLIIKLLNSIVFCFSGNTRNSKICSVLEALFCNVVRFLRSCIDFYNDDVFTFDIKDFYIWDDFRGTGIIDTVSNGVHFLKYSVFRKANNFPSIIFNTKNQFTTSAISEGDHSFQIFVLVFWNI